MIKTVSIRAFDDQKPGTSGLRKKTVHFMQPDYLEAYIQSIFNAVPVRRMLLGGDGRTFNDAAIAQILRMAAANGVEQVIVGQNGLMSTPAASHLIRKHGLDGGIILSASHNPAGPDGDFGVKFNGANGGPVPDAVTDAIYARTKEVSEYRITGQPAPAPDRIGETMLGDMRICVVDPVEDYAALMRSLFDFDAIRAMFQGGFTLCFDAMHAVTGPYARAIFEGELGAAAGSVIHAVPLPDFGGGHPDPNPVWARGLMERMFGDDAPDFGAASDGDGDRNMIVGRGIYVGPSDSLAVLAAHMPGLVGVARSMPTSSAVDAVARARGVPAYAVPTGWKYFGNLLDAGLISICGEESAGTGGDHVREKDGIWAVLAWLELLAKRRQPVTEIMQAHWRDYGRHYFARHDFEEIDSAAADALVGALRENLSGLGGQSFMGLTVKSADDFTYTDPVDGSVAQNQGVIIRFETGERAMIRLSGTGTSGATLRLYLERPVAGPKGLDMNPAQALQPLASATYSLIRLTGFTGRDAPDVIS